MHMADALVSPAVGTAMYALSAATTVYSVKKVRLESDPKKIPVMGVMGAFVFAAQMINFTIPGTGSSGHLCGGMMLTALLGPHAAFLTMIAILAIQCLMFADGGLLALGCNIWNMAFYGCFVGYFLIWKPMMKKEISKKRIAVGSILGCVLTLQLGAFSVTLETLLSGISSLPFGVFVGTMQPIHLAIGFVEGLITTAVLIFVYESRPELLECSEYTESKNRFSLKKTLAILGICVVFIGGALSLAASSNPDGLEWSIERLTGSADVEANGSVYEKASKVQEKTAILPDYAFKDSESEAGTSFSGIMGSAVVIVVCVGACYAFNFFRKNSDKKRRKDLG
ncbi:MAG: energy-coupling factor ABC transporter permease [Lachnospiraceae bacterium]